MYQVLLGIVNYSWSVAEKLGMARLGAASKHACAVDDRAHNVVVASMEELLAARHPQAKVILPFSLTAPRSP